MVKPKPQRFIRFYPQLSAFIPSKTKPLTFRFFSVFSVFSVDMLLSFNL